MEVAGHKGKVEPKAEPKTAPIAKADAGEKHNHTSYVKNGMPCVDL